MGIPHTTLLIGAVATLFCFAGSVRSTDRIDADDGGYAQHAVPFLEQHCLRCHTGAKAKAELDLTQYASLEQLLVDREEWTEVRDRVRHHEMPPKGEPRPTAAELETFIAWLQAGLTRPSANVDPGYVPPRRLNRVEYRNTVRDLLGVDFDPSETFPVDDVGHGFDNNADVLSLSPLLVEKYLAAAETIADRAVRDPQLDGPPSIQRPAADLRSDRGKLYGRVISMSTSAETYFEHDVTTEGRYLVRATCHGQQAGPESVQADFRIDRQKMKTVSIPATREHPAVYEAEVRLEPGRRKIGIAFTNDYYSPKDPDPNNRDRNMYVHGMELVGPLDSAALTDLQRRWLPSGDAQPSPPKRGVAEQKAALRRAVVGLGERAFRRPLTTDDVDALLTVVDRSVDAGASNEARLRIVITALLASPRFLFRLETTQPTAPPSTPLSSNRGQGTETSSRPLDDFELASRLSYFLWSSMPDEALFRAARAGELSTAEGTSAQVRRMLRDPRSLALADNFATQWLQIRDLQQHEPDPLRFPDVDRSLRDAMRQETVLLFDAILRENRSVWTLLDADFTFVNEPLAELYEIGGVRGPWMRRVPAGSRGGGVLAHASVLTSTSNATRTSPVKRGKWILEALLDSAPPPPPPEVEGLKEEEAGRDGATLRELLERHRADPSCSTCHDRMDALGFSLESFDPIGRVRHAEGRHEIDDTGQLPDGRSFRGIGGLRQVLLGERDFLRSLSKHLLVYAIGRGAEPTDEPALERVTAALEVEPTIERAVLEIVQLDAFRRRRVESNSKRRQPR